MRQFLTASLLVLSLSALSFGQCALSSSPSTNSGFPGIMFNVRNLSAAPMDLTGFDVNIDANVTDVQVWVTPMPADTVLTDQTMWTLVESFAGISSNGLNVFTGLPPFATPITLPVGATYGIYLFSPQTGSPINYQVGTAANATSATDGALEIFEGWGRNSPLFSASPISGRIPSVAIRYSVAGITANDYQENSARAALTIDGVNGQSCLPTILNREIFACAAPVPLTGQIEFRTPNVGLPYDFALTTAPVVAATAPGSFVFADGQILNISLFAAPVFLNGFFQQTVPGFGFPGVSGATLRFDYSLTAAIDYSVQAVVFDPTRAVGVSLSQATEFHAAVVPPLTTVAGPLTDSSSVLVDLSNPATCWAPAIPFHGTLYTQFWVSSNGRVTFVGTDTDGGASVAEVATDNPFVGYWCDLNPALGGSITASNPAPGIIRVDYANVPYAGEAATSNSFAIEFDVAAGTVAIDGLLGITANPQTTLSTTNDDALLGLTAGNQGGTTAGGPTVFSFGGSGLAANGTDAWFEHYDAVAGGPGIVSSLAAGTLNRLFFVPSGAFGTNYDWFGL